MKTPSTQLRDYLSSEALEKLKLQRLMGEINESDYRWLLGEGEDDANYYSKKRVRRTTNSRTSIDRPGKNTRY